MKALELHQMEQIEGGGFWSGCGRGLATAFLGGYIAVGALSAGTVAAIALAGGCIAGGLDEVL